MPINNTGAQVALSDIRTELSLSTKTDFSLDGAENGDIANGYAQINLCSSLKPSSNDPVSLTEWRGYNHTIACNSASLNAVYCNYTTNICDQSYSSSTSQTTSTALSYAGCILWDLGVYSGTTLATAGVEYSATLTFSTDPASTNWTVKPSATDNTVRHYPTDKISATESYLIAAKEVSISGSNFVRFGCNLYLLRQVFPTQTDFYVHIYARRTGTSVPVSMTNYYLYSQKRQTLVNSTASSAIDFGTTLQESNTNVQANITMTFANSNDLAFKRVGYLRYNKSSDTTTWTTV